MIFTKQGLTKEVRDCIGYVDTLDEAMVEFRDLVSRLPPGVRIAEAPSIHFASDGSRSAFVRFIDATAGSSIDVQLFMTASDVEIFQAPCA